MKNHSLFTIVLVVFFVLIMISFAVVFFSIKECKQDLIENAIKEKIDLAKIIDQNIAPSSKIYDSAATSEIEKVFIEEMANFEDVYYVRVVDSDGTIYKSSIKGENGEIIKDSDILKAIDTEKEIVKDNIYKNEPIKLIICPGHQNKTIWIGFTLKPIDRVIQSIWFKDILNLIFLLFFSVFVLFIILRNIISPLREIILACEEVKKGNLGVKISVKSGSEIDKFADTFNSIIKNLKNSYSFLDKARKRTEQEKNRIIDIIANFTDGLFVLDRENKLSLINPCAEDFLEIKSKEVINKSVSELSKFKFFKKLIRALTDPVSGNLKIKKIFRKEMIMTPNLILEVSAIPVFKEGQRIETLVILHNITREKRIEQTKTEFVSISAHQLRTPLSAIKWTLRMLLDGDLGTINKKQKEFIEKTYKSNERMISLINDLLNVTRIEEGRYLYKKELSDVENICRDVIKFYQEKIKTKKIKFKFIAPDRSLKVSIDKEKIDLAIRNIFENAIKYTPSKGNITMILDYGIKELKFSVSDTGVGIPVDQQYRVFTKFFRGANIIRMDTEGTGLGLFIAKNIIIAHKGRIWFESKEREGTTFYFTLPIRT